MGWRKQMGISELKSPIQKVQNIQKPPEQIPFVPIVPFVYRESKTKTDQTPPPDLSKIQPGHTQEYITLWYQACELEAYTSSEAPYPERVAKLPELNRMVERMRVLEDRTKAAISSRPVKKIPGLPDDLFQAPAVWKPVEPDHEYHREKCPACGQCQWWRKKEPCAKWICGRCHPPVPGLDVIYE